MGSDDISRIGGVKAAADHGEGRGGHHKVHQRIRDRRTDHRDRDHGCADQLGPGAAHRAALRGLARFGDAQADEQEHAQKVQRDDG